MTHSWNNYSWWTPGVFVGFGALGILTFTLITILVIIMIALKGYALWYAAKRDEKWWFVIMLIINTAGLLELIYIVFFVKKWHKKLGSGTGTSANPPVKS